MNNLLNLKKRLDYYGGQVQQDRMLGDKRRSLDYAIKHSYQGASLEINGEQTKIPALINPNKNSLDYDDKTVSVGFEYKITPGTVFTWRNTETKWIVYSQDLTELAYFKGDIRKCNHYIKWINEAGEEQHIDVAIIGPGAAKITGLMNANFYLDQLNYTIKIIAPKTNEVLSYFTRYKKFYLFNYQENNTPICWRVESIDAITNEGILEIFAKEYYSNTLEDDCENGLVGTLIQKPSVVDNKVIVGDSFIIKPGFDYKYEYTGTSNGYWQISENVPVKIISHDAKNIVINWYEFYDGKFELIYGEDKQEIVVESLF